MPLVAATVAAAGIPRLEFTARRASFDAISQNGDVRASPSFPAARDEVNIIIHGTVPYYNERVPSACSVMSRALRRTTATYVGLLDMEIRKVACGGVGRVGGRRRETCGKDDAAKYNYLPWRAIGAVILYVILQREVV